MQGTLCHPKALITFAMGAKRLSHRWFRRMRNPMAEALGQRRFGAGGEPAKRANPGRGLVIALNFAAASHRRAVALLAVCCALFFLPGFFNIPPIDRDEARFAQATKQMVETGDYIDIRYQDEVRYKKPVGIYWLQTRRRRGGHGARRCRTREPASGSIAFPR